MSLIPLPPTLIPFLNPYLPNTETTTNRPFVTLTYAQSLDSKIAAQPGQQTKLSHLETKTMTHYLRSKHDSIFIGIGTVLADDPKLNYIKSVMIEGGAKVINDLLINRDNLVDSLIITVAPVFLGKNGVDVSPNHQVNLKDMTWWTGVQDSVLAARLQSNA
ncbi:2,5-diamino-6-ribosylamino-4(3H)-pyrimidinone 5'-phosphate reductase [Candida tropicalis]